MSLPKFTDPSPTIESLVAENKRLKTQADKMLAATKIEDIFSKYGEYQGIGGSYKYGLMVYPDLDTGIITETVTKEEINSLVSDLLNNLFVRSLNCVNNVDFPSKSGNRPKGYWIGLEIPFENDRWGVDFWFQQKEWLQSIDDPYFEKLKDLDQASKDSILNLKYQLIYRGLYGNKFFSNDVYDAVLRDGPKTIEQFLS